MLALTTGQRLGLLSVALVFIAFALASSFLFPRFRPDFPGRGLKVFVAITLILTVAMLGAVEVFAKEEEAEEAHATETTPTTTGETTTGETTTGQTTTEPAGDAAAGRSVFTSAGCGSCHTVGAAGTEAETGPNLDESLEGKDAGYVRQAIVDPNAEIAEGYSEGIMPPNYEEQLSDKQLDDLVAFLTQ